MLKSALAGMTDPQIRSLNRGIIRKFLSKLELPRQNYFKVLAIAKLILTLFRIEDLLSALSAMGIFPRAQPRSFGLRQVTFIH